MACILVIDDNDLFRASVKDLLAVNGHDIALAVDGDDGGPAVPGKGDACLFAVNEPSE